MTLDEVFEQLVSGELSQISIAGGEQGEITEAAYPKLVNHVNLGLTALFKRFSLKQGSMKVQLVPGHDTYTLDSKYAASNTKSKELVKYLLDEGKPFKDDALKIESVVTDLGIELVMNQAGDPFSVSTPSMLTLKVPMVIVDQPPRLPGALRTEHLEVTYRANHPKITVGLGYFNPARVEVELPDSHLEALCYFVAGRMAAPAGMTTEERLNNVWYAKYEGECQRLEADGLQIVTGYVNDRATRNGWV
jgi:hypothetical protein